MPALQTVHTADLTARLEAEAHALLEAAFAGDFGDEDWGHSLGGMHVLARDDGRLVGHAAVVLRRLVHGDRALRCGYVEGVGVAPDARGRGVGGRLMDEAERLVRGSTEIGALGATDAGMRLYLGRGWRPWRGPLAALTPHGVVPTPDESGTVLVLEVDGVPLDSGGELVADLRDGDAW